MNMSKTKLVETGALYSQLIGLEEVPMLTKKTLRAMGLMGTPGLIAAPKAAKHTGGLSRKDRGELARFSSEGGYQSIRGRKKHDRHEENEKRGGSSWRTHTGDESKPSRSARRPSRVASREERSRERKSS